MHPTFSNYTRGQRVPSYQQQSGQTIYNIGAFGPYPITMSHMPANILVNQPLQRTFASVVSCENPNFGTSHNFEDTPVDNSGIFNSFFKRLTNQQPKTSMPPQPQLYQQYTHKEFEDFKKMPTVKNPQPANYTNSYSTPLSFPGNYENVKMPFMYQSAFYQSPPQPQPSSQKQHHHTPRPSRNLFNAFWGNFSAPPQQQQHQQHSTHQKPNNNNQRWYQKGFNRFRCNRNNNHKPQQQNRHHSRFHHSDASNPKHMHEKERNSIERDIRNDYCDIRYKKKYVEDPQQKCKNNNTETAKTSSNDCDNSRENPPFEIFSLEEFPAIPACNASTSKSQEMDHDHDFVTYKDNAAATTPTYTPAWPRRISLCEKVSKIVKSPQKLLPLNLATPRRSCLKPTMRNRSMSECSDDFIVFEYSCTDGENDDFEIEIDEDDESDDEDNESEISEDTIMGEESEDLDEVDEAMGREKERMQSDNQPDSGIDGEFGHKKVHFNLTPTVHVMHAWPFAYRASRDGKEWIQSSRDRERFRKRCSDLEDVVRPILNSSHRDKIFKERFQGK